MGQRLRLWRGSATLCALALLLDQPSVQEAFDLPSAQGETCFPLGSLKKIQDEVILTPRKYPVRFSTGSVMGDIQKMVEACEDTEQFVQGWLSTARNTVAQNKMKIQTDDAALNVWPEGGAVILKATPSQRYKKCFAINGHIPGYPPADTIRPLTRMLEAFDTTSTYISASFDNDFKQLRNLLDGLTYIIPDEAAAGFKAAWKEGAAIAIEVPQDSNLKGEQVNMKIIQKDISISYVCVTPLLGPLATTSSTQRTQNLITQLAGVKKDLGIWKERFKATFGTSTVKEATSSTTVAFKSLWYSSLVSLSERILKGNYKTRLDFPEDLDLVKNLISTAKRFLFTNSFSPQGLFSKYLPERLRQILPGTELRSDGIALIRPLSKPSQLPVSPFQLNQPNGSAPAHEDAQNLPLATIESNSGLRVQVFQIQKTLTTSLFMFKYDFLIRLGAHNPIFTSSSPQDFLRCRHSSSAGIQSKKVCHLLYNPPSDSSQCTLAFFQPHAASKQELENCMQRVPKGYIQLYRRRCLGQPEEHCISTNIENLPLDVNCLQSISSHFKISQPGSYCLKSCSIRLHSRVNQYSSQHIRARTPGQLNSITWRDDLIHSIQSHLRRSGISNGQVLLITSSVLIATISGVCALISLVWHCRTRQIQSRSPVGGQHRRPKKKRCAICNCCRRKSPKEPSVPRHLKENHEAIVDILPPGASAANETTSDETQIALLKSTESRPVTFYERGQQVTKLPAGSSLLVKYRPQMPEDQITEL